MNDDTPTPPKPAPTHEDLPSPPKPVWSRMNPPTEVYVIRPDQIQLLGEQLGIDPK